MSGVPSGEATIVGDATGPPLSRLGDVLEPGSVVGRYMVLSRIGAGGMGVVYAAYDPELDRKIALKLLLTSPGGSSGSSDREHRLIKQEAQALAKLAHPNVITVHDVGEHDGRVFLAMEFVDGQTLADWEDGEHDWREALEMYRRAGEGLRAAHEQGLVHRDFKPENVMVGRDGRVRVMDFGLARTTATATMAPASPGAAPIVSSGATGAGGVVGTPAYMAPEQFTGATVDARSDQFSFCVAVWQAVYGQRPFAGDDLVSLLATVQSGELSEPPAGHGVPPWVHRVLVRGLKVEPEERWPSMEALLRELAPPPERTRGVATVVGGVAVVGVVAFALLRPSGEVPCEAPGSDVAETWDGARRTAVEQALLATEQPYAANTWSRVQSGLDGYARQWTEVRHRLCTSPPQDGLGTARTLCLERRRQALRSTVEVLEQADAAVLDKAVETIARLPDPTRCVDVAYVSAAVEPPSDPAVARQVESLRQQLSRVDALRFAGKPRQAQQVLAPVLEAAEGLGYEPLAGEALLASALLRADEGRAEDAVTQAREAYERLLAIGHDEPAASAALLVASALGAQQNRPDEGAAWLPSARALAQRAELGPGFEARLLGVTGDVQLARGDLDQAQVVHERSLALRVELHGPDHVSVAAPALALGRVHAQRGELDRAAQFTERAQQVTEAALGPDHPDVAGILRNLGNLHLRRGDIEGARSLYERSIALTQAAYGSDYPDLALTLSNLGALSRAAGDLDAARDYYEQSLTIAERTSGADHPNAAIALTNLSPILQLQKDVPGAVRTAQRAVDIWEARLGDEPAHANAAAAVHNLANALQAANDLEAAQAQFERAIELWEQVVGKDNFALLEPLVGLADVLLRRDRPAEALVQLVRVQKMLEHPDAPGFAVGMAAFMRARTDWALSGRFDRDTLQQARDRMAASPEAAAQSLAGEVDRWMAEVVDARAVDLASRR